MSERHYAFLGGNGAAVALHEEEGLVIVALAFCNPKDTFDKQRAKHILDGRLDARLDPARKKPVKHTFIVPYSGRFSRRDILKPAIKFLRTLPKDRSRKLINHTPSYLIPPGVIR